MTTPSKVKKIMYFICLSFFLLGLNPKIYTLKQFLPVELSKQLLIENCLNRVIFLILLSIALPLKITYKGKNFYIIFLFDAVVILYTIFSYVYFL